MDTKTEKINFIEGLIRNQTSLCEECGEEVSSLKFERDEEGWMWCKGCGLVKNDGVKKRLDEMGEGAWYDFVKVLVPSISIKELRMLEKSRSRMDAVNKLKKMQLNLISTRIPIRISTNIPTNIPTLDSVIDGDI